MQPTSRVGTAFEGSNSPRGPSGASEPPDVFCGLASLIVEGRIPRNDGRGYGEGPHVPQTASKSLSSRHECCNENNVVSLKIYEIWYFWRVFWQLSTKLQAILSARKMNVAMKTMWQEILICC